jgi:hypothetical protein
MLKIINLNIKLLFIYLSSVTRSATSAAPIFDRSVPGAMTANLFTSLYSFFQRQLQGFVHGFLGSWGYLGFLRVSGHLYIYQIKKINFDQKNYYFAKHIFIW